MTDKQKLYDIIKRMFSMSDTYTGKIKIELNVNHGDVSKIEIFPGLKIT